MTFYIYILLVKYNVYYLYNSQKQDFIIHVHVPLEKLHSGTIITSYSWKKHTAMIALQCPTFMDRG